MTDTATVTSLVIGMYLLLDAPSNSLKMNILTRDSSVNEETEIFIAFLCPIHRTNLAVFC